jgi:hypothetical protein
LWYDEQSWGQKLSHLQDKGLSVTIGAEPFGSTYFSHSKGGAYPHSSSNPLLPLLLYFTWTSPTADVELHAAIKESTQTLLNAAVSEGQDIAGSKQIVYNNYALPDTPLQSLYGSNLPRLKQIKEQYDPHNVMGLTGGFKL